MNQAKRNDAGLDPDVVRAPVTTAVIVLQPGHEHYCWVCGRVSTKLGLVMSYVGGRGYMPTYICVSPCVGDALELAGVAP